MDEFNGLFAKLTSVLFHSIYGEQLNFDVT